METPRLKWTALYTLSFKGYEAKIKMDERGETTWSLAGPQKGDLLNGNNEATSIQDAQFQVESRIAAHAKEELRALLKPFE